MKFCVLNKMTEYLPIFIPAIAGFGTAMICNVGKDAGSVVAFRPPSWVFSVAWIIVYALFGLSWYFARKDANDKNQKLYVDIANIVLVCVISLWIVIYACGKNKKGGVYVLGISILASLIAYTVASTTLSKILICPLVAWLIFAMFLNTFEVQKLK